MSLSRARDMPAHTHRSIRKTINANVGKPSLQVGHHSMMGSTKDPKDGKAVAGSVFAAVVVYAVCYTHHSPQIFVPSERMGPPFPKDISSLVQWIRREIIS